MIPRTPIGDLVAALALVSAIALLIYTSAHDGRLGIIDRRTNPLGFWVCLAGAGLLVAGVALLIAWEAVAALRCGA